MWSKKIFSLLLGCLISLTAFAQRLSEKAQISVLTCSPGEEIYTLYGHTAIRVWDPANELDIVLHYGIFDFDTDWFYYKFFKGETYYEMGASSMRRFMYEYQQTDRPVYEQVLHLTPDQKQAIWEALLINYQPENSQYLYNFVYDNCATRPYKLIANILGDTIISDYTGYTGRSYRAFIRHYTGRWSWTNAGISLLFGPKASHPMSSDERLFLPEELMRFLQQAHLSDGTPVVDATKTHPIGTFKIARTPWYASWPFGLLLFFFTIAVISVYDRRRGRWSWGVDAVVGVLYLLLLLAVAFLTFFSLHPLVGFGWRLLIIPFTHLCARIIYIARL